MKTVPLRHKRTRVDFTIPPVGSLTPNGDSDPLSYYYKTFIKKVYRRRIENGLRLLKSRYGTILEFGYGSGILLPTLFMMSEKLYAIDLNSRNDIVQTNLKKLDISAELSSKDLVEECYPSSHFDLIVAFSCI